MNTPELTPAQQYVRDQALEAAEKGLRRAHAFFLMKGGTFGFKSTMRSRGMPPVFVRFDLDSVLRCYDATSYELMYQSLPGKLDRLATGKDKPVL